MNHKEITAEYLDKISKLVDYGIEKILLKCLKEAEKGERIYYHEELLSQNQINGLHEKGFKVEKYVPELGNFYKIKW